MVLQIREPALMQAPVSCMPAHLGSFGRQFPSGPHEPGGSQVGPAVMPGRFNQQPAGVGVAGLGDRAAGPGRPGGLLGRDQTKIGADAGSSEPVPVPDLHGQPERGQGGNAPQAAQALNHGGVFAVQSHACDGGIQIVAAFIDGPHPGQAGPVGQFPGGFGKVLPVQPDPVLPGPRLPVGIDDALAQQEFGDPVSGTHQVRPAVLPCPDQVPGCFLIGRGNPHPGDLSQLQQPGQVQGVTGVCLDPVPGRALEFGRGRDHCLETGRVQVPGQTETGRSGLVNHPDGAGQGTDPVQDLVRSGVSFRCRISPVSLSRAQPATERAWTSKPTLVRSNIAGTSQTSNVALQVGQVWQVTHVLALKSGGSSPRNPVLHIV